LDRARSKAGSCGSTRATGCASIAAAMGITNAAVNARGMVRPFEVKKA
jgi:hypothetical protein